MAKHKAISALEERLENILQTEKHRDRFLVGSQAEFRDPDGQICVPRVLSRLAESEPVVQARL